MTRIPQTLTTAQFDALAELSTYQKNASVREAMRLHFVDGMPLADAARQTNILYRVAWRAAQKLERRYALAWKAAGIPTEKIRYLNNGCNTLFLAYNCPMQLRKLHRARRHLAGPGNEIGANLEEQKNMRADQIAAQKAMAAHYEAALEQISRERPGLFGKELDRKARRRALRLAGVTLPEGVTIAWATPPGWATGGYRRQALDQKVGAA